jgi:hypothetical protein
MYSCCLITILPTGASSLFCNYFGNSCKYGTPSVGPSHGSSLILLPTVGATNNSHQASVAFKLSSRESALLHIGKE